MSDTRIVNAIAARIAGVFDDRDLRELGPLFPDRMEDIARLLSMRTSRRKIKT
jgi:hypothetical protein